MTVLAYTTQEKALLGIRMLLEDPDKYPNPNDRILAFVELGLNEKDSNEAIKAIYKILSKNWTK